MCPACSAPRAEAIRPGSVVAGVALIIALRGRNGHGKRQSLTEADVVSILAGQRQAERALQETTEFRAHVMRELAMLKDALGPERHAELVRAFEDVMSRELAPIRQDIRQLKRGDVA